MPPPAPPASPAQVPSAPAASEPSVPAPVPHKINPPPAAAAAPPATELKVGAAGLPPWRRYAVAAPPADGRPRIAIDIDDVGPDVAAARAAIALPPPVTLAFLPYARDVAELARAARAAGHELLVHVPMEPIDLAHNDPGPNALLVSLAPAEILRRLRWDLGRFQGYVGINNHMGSRFTADSADMELVLGVLKRRGLMFFDSRTSAASVGAKLAARLGVPDVSRDVFLDDSLQIGRIEAQLAVTEREAREHGQAIAIGHPHPTTLEALRHWLPEAKAKGFELVPLTALVRARALSG